MGVSLVTLPEGADPDSFVGQFGGEAFVAYLDRERQDFPSFIVEAARRSGALDTPEGKADTARRLVEAVSRVRDPVAQDAYVGRAAAALQVPDATMRQLLRRRGRANTPERRAAGGGDGAASVPPIAIEMRPEEAELLRLMLSEGASMVEFVMSHMSIDEFSEGPVRAAVAALIAQYESGEVEPDAFLRGEFGEEIQRLVAGVMSDPYSVSPRGASRRGVAPERRDARPRAAAGSAMRLLKLDRIEEALAEVKRQIFLAEQSGADSTDLYHRVTALTDLRARVDRGAFLEWNAT
jgi:DNA primase